MKSLAGPGNSTASPRHEDDLSRPATSYPSSVHVYALLSHFVFGAAAESVRRQLRARL